MKLCDLVLTMCAVVICGFLHDEEGCNSSVVPASIATPTEQHQIKLYAECLFILKYLPITPFQQSFPKTKIVGVFHRSFDKP